MDSDSQRQRTATAAAEEILRLIYGDDLTGCTVSLDRITEVIAGALASRAEPGNSIAELHEKAFEAIQLLSTPPPDGQTLGADELRSLLGDRLDKIQNLASKVIAATIAQRTEEPADLPADDESIP